MEEEIPTFLGNDIRFQPATRLALKQLPRRAARAQGNCLEGEAWEGEIPTFLGIREHESKEHARDGVARAVHIRGGIPGDHDHTEIDCVAFLTE